MHDRKDLEVTVAVPNFFLEQRPESIRMVGNIYIKRALVSTKAHRVRNTMHALLVVLKGSKTLHVSERKLSLEAGSAAFFMRGDYFVSQNDGEYRALAIYFDERFASRFENIVDDDSTDVKRVVHTNCDDRGAVLALAETLWKDVDQKGVMEDELALSRVETLFRELIALDKEYMMTFFRTIVKDAGNSFADLLIENLDMIESVKDMSRLVRMSPAHFYRRFKEEFGVSPKRWLIEKNLQKGAALLKRGEMSVAEVASECGYATTSSFIHAFKKRFGSTPKSYMIENR